MSEGQSYDPRAGPGNLLQGLWPYLRPYHWPVLGITFLLLVSVGAEAALPLGLKFLIDFALGPRDYGALTLVLSLLAAGVLLASGAAIGRDYLYAVVGSHVLNDLRLALFDQLQRLSSEFYSRVREGDILARFSTDLAAVENTVATILPWGLMAALNIVVSLMVLLLLQWQLAIITLIGAPLCLLGPRFLAPHAARAGYEVKRGEAGVTGTVQEYLHGHPAARAFGMEGTLRAAFIQRLDRLFGCSRRFNFLSGLVQRTPNLAVEVVHLLVLGTGAWMTFHGALTVGSLVSFDAIFLNFSGSVADLTEIVPSFLRAASGMRRIQELLDEAPRVTDPASPLPLPALSEAIQFRDVTFGYTEERPALDGVSFTIPHGSSVAFVGPSGSGKSTVLSLLLRFYDPNEGAVTLGGVDLRQVRQAELRLRMGAVLQESFLSSGTIRENLLPGKPDASQAEIERAAQAAEIHDFIRSLPRGYETPVGERGGLLSGGQRQRLALARALLRNPGILLLDEATSALDPATEAAVNRTLARVSRGRTVVTVTHRLSTAMAADRIFVLDGGRVVEQGRHEALLQQEGVYAELWRKQQGFHVSRDGEQAAVEPARLQMVPLLATLDDMLLDEVALRFGAESIPAGRLVLQEGDPGDRFYLIARGKVAVTRQDAAGTEQPVAVLQDGDYFGEMALLRSAPRNATVRTVSPCLFLTLQRGPFLNLLERAPGLRQQIEETMGLRLDETRSVSEMDALSAAAPG